MLLDMPSDWNVTDDFDLAKWIPWGDYPDNSDNSATEEPKPSKKPGICF